jgi:hypothetical protein
MKILGMGVDFAGNPLFAPMDENTIANALVSALDRNAESVRTLARTTAKPPVLFGGGEMEPPPQLNERDPREVGWTFLINSADPQREDIERILKPLAMHRNKPDAKEPLPPLLYNGESPDEWLNSNYCTLNTEKKQAPHYVLIVGEPNQVPFHFQSVLDTVANVGRIAFDTPDDLKQYVDKLIRIETAAEPIVTKEVVMFAPDHGKPDATYYTRKYMVEPLAKSIQDELGFATHTILGDDANKMNLKTALSIRNPALVYTASHGVYAKDRSIDMQKRYNGAICCQYTGEFTLNSLFSADDVPLDQPFLEGAVFFQFACLGYGTPAESYFKNWLEEVPEKYAEADFIAALPKRLLAHPRGPIAFIGHLDSTLVHGFADPADLSTLEELGSKWDARIAPFKTAVDQLLRVQPSGLAMKDMNSRYSIYNTEIQNKLERQQHGDLEWNQEDKARFVDEWITRGDAQNYMIFGDPAVHLRIPT